MISFSRAVQPPHSKDFFQKQFEERDEDFMMLICTPKSPTYQCSQQLWDVLECTALQVQSEQCRPPILTPGEVWKLQDLTYQVWPVSRWVTPVLAAESIKQYVLILWLISVYYLHQFIYQWLLPYRCESGALGASESLGSQLRLLATTVEVAGIVISAQPYNKLKQLVSYPSFSCGLSMFLILTNLTVVFLAKEYTPAH